MEQIMMMKRRTKRKLQASLGTYVIILFGLSVMLYLCGFQSVWNTYTNQQIAVGASGADAGITDPGISGQAGGGTSSGIFNNMMLLMIGIIGGLLAGSYIFYKIVNRIIGGSDSSNPTQQTVNLIFPIIPLIVITNVFIFPIADVQQYMAGMDVSGFNISWVLVAFLNLWLILGIVEYVRGTQL